MRELSQAMANLFTIIRTYYKQVLTIGPNGNTKTISCVEGEKMSKFIATGMWYDMDILNLCCHQYES